MRGLRVPLRLAGREVRRRPGRTMLVALLVAVPVCGMVLASVLFRTEAPGAVERFRLLHGGADAVAASTGMPTMEGHAHAEAAAPAGVAITEVRTAAVRVEGPGGDRRLVDAVATPASLPAPGAPRLLRTLDGRLPRGELEVALTPAAARAVRAAVGDDVVLSVAPAGLGSVPPPAAPPEVDSDAGVVPDRTVAVVGVVEDPSCLSCRRVVHASDAELVAPASDVTTAALVTFEGPPPADLVELLVTSGARVRPDLVPDDDGSVGVRWAIVIGAVALTVAGIVISAAFAVGARRQLTTLGQLSAAGASPAVVRRALVLQGTVTGVVGVVAGGLLAALVATLGRTSLEVRVLDHRIPGWTVSGRDLLVIGVVGVAAATVAALIPARTAARVPTLAALAGRRPQAPVPARVPVAGLVAIAIGLALLSLAVVGARSGESGDTWALTAVVGGVVQLLGACALAPAIVARLEPLAARLRGSWRLGARSLARSRARTGAVVAAVAATGALAVFGGGMVRGLESRDGWSIEVGRLPEDMVALSVSAEVDGAWPDGAGGAPQLLSGDIVGQEDPAGLGGPWPEACGHRPCAQRLDGAIVALPRVCAERFCEVLPVDPSGRPDDPPRLVVLPPSCDLEHCDVAPDGTVRRWQASVPSADVLGAVALILGPVRAHELAHVVPTEPLVARSSAEAGDLEVGEFTVGSVTVVDPAVFEDLRVGPDLVAALEEFGAVVHFALWDQAAFSDEVRYELTAGPGRTVEAPAVSPADLGGIAAGSGVGGFTVIATPAGAEALGIGPDFAPTVTVVRALEGMDDEQRGALYELSFTGSDDLSVHLDHPDRTPSPLQLQLALSALAVAAAVLVIATSLALAAAEGRDEREVLATVGARPADLARAAGARAALLAGIGGTMAVPLGLLPVRVVASSLSSPFPVLPPWPTIALLCAGVPVVAGLVTAGGSAAAQRARPLQISSATFE